MKNIFHANKITLTADVATGVGLRSVDLFARSPQPDNCAVTFKLRTNATAPGASKNVTAHYALATEPGLTVDQLSEADAEQVLPLPNVASSTRQFTIPVLLLGQRYLYFWFDNDALTTGATIEIDPIVNT